ncbi:unnamed protein product [Timema podura]|uniref:Uncharacterized protein n=1 Tax=Timema podura TaxID=61482 RepID=A0ABN7NVY0_TIMPD|nr:unnamed protein product [Timema podura]
MTRTYLILVVCLSTAALLCRSEEIPKRAKVSDEQLELALSDKRDRTRDLWIVPLESKRLRSRKLRLMDGEFVVLTTLHPLSTCIGTIFTNERRSPTLAPLVLRGACPQCTPEETRQIQRTLSHIQRHYPKEWSKIVKQYAGA